MIDYKATLNLPHTDFAMKANLAEREPKTLARWQATQLYQRLRQARLGAPQFILHDGPPYANGDIHIGHAVNKVLKDIIIKAKTLSGFDAPYVPGWDCHGLPIEHNVEKKIGKAGTKVPFAQFRQACRDYASAQVAGQKRDFQRLGVLGDWDKPYLTMDFKTEADTVRALGRIAANGHLQQGFKPVYWSVVGGSALAEAEVEYHEKTSQALDVCFPVQHAADLAQRLNLAAPIDGACIVIWTTTPWTLPANQAVCLNAELDYSLISARQNGSPRMLLIATNLLKPLSERAGLTDVSILAQCAGSALEGLVLQHPFENRSVPVLLGEHVSADAGTGAVHTAPDHGVDDFTVGRRYGLGTLNLLDDNGFYREQVPFFAGDHVYKVDDKVIQILQDNDNLLNAATLVHSYPHCWRTKTPLIFRATPQWFISMTQKGLLAAVQAAVDTVEWLPSWGEARIRGMLDASPDWCISRQRTWGVPIALFIHRDTNALHPRTPELIEQVAQRIEQQGIDAWFDLDPATLLGDEAADYRKVTDTLDVWFDSGVTHSSVLEKHPALQFPADLYLEGSDQHRGWFQSSLKTALAIQGKAPYKQVLTHGFAVDQNGHKMSKSLGNVIPPQQVFNNLGADVLRLWVAATDFAGDMSVSDTILNRTADSYRRIRNTIRYLLANLGGFQAAEDLLAPESLVALDAWAIQRTAKLQTELLGHYERYEFHLIYQKLHNFCVVDLGGFYLDITKDRVYTTPAKSQARRSAQTAQYHISQALVRWIAPILSFTADEIWQVLAPIGGQDPEKDPIFAQTWYPLPDAAALALPEATVALLSALKGELNKQLEVERASGRLGKSLEAAVTVYADEAAYARLAALGDELRFVLLVSHCTLAPLAKAPVSSPTETETATGLPGIVLRLARSEAPKCVRCWHQCASVGRLAQHPELCQRCVTNLTPIGEDRRYA
jgi:isoleucyl-tRNA synthetase